MQFGFNFIIFDATSIWNATFMKHVFLSFYFDTIIFKKKSKTFRYLNYSFLLQFILDDEFFVTSIVLTMFFLNIID